MRKSHVALAGSSGMGWLLLSVSVERLEPQLISAFTCESAARRCQLRGCGWECEGASPLSA
jgi:hypothetical protein